MNTVSIPRLQGASVLVLGLGESGLAMARWCARHGASVRVWDSRAAPPRAAALAEQVPDAVLSSGELDAASALDGCSLVLKSPGLAPGDARAVGVLRLAAGRSIAVQGELDLFAEALAALERDAGYAPKVIAITGTNGKTTTTAMTALLVERAGRSVAVAGNIGPTMLQTLADRLAASAQEPDGRAMCEPLPDVWVLELSSFQLDGVTGFEPSAAAVLNLTQDHLDWHGSMAAYGAAKARVFGERAVLVVNRDDAEVEALVPVPGQDVKAARGAKAARAAHAEQLTHAAQSAQAAIPPKAPKRRARSVVERQVVRFGLGTPEHAGDYGIVTENGIAWLVRANPPEADGARRRRAATPPAELSIQRLMPADALRVRGRHNAANALAALALAGAIGCTLAPMLHALRDYRGEPHRVEFIASVAGVDAFDDSKGTNVGATVAALDGLGADRAPAKLVVILGGDGKGQDFAPLVAPLARHARAVATLGRAADAIERAIAGSGLPIERHPTLEAATRWCFEQARAGDAVLLSPACASLDMFRDYAHRAAVFVAEVHAAAADRAGVLA